MVSVVAEQPKTFADAFQRGYARLFEEQWPYWVGGILLGLTNVFLFAYARPWSAADGVRNWGDWVFNSVNILDKNIIPPHLYSTSVSKFWFDRRRLGSRATCPSIQRFAWLQGENSARVWWADC